MAGLPPEEENSDDELDEQAAADYDSDDDDDKPLDINKSVMDGLKLFRSKADETTERQLNADKRVAGSHRRDWDDDKEVNMDDFSRSIADCKHIFPSRLNKKMTSRGKNGGSWIKGNG